MNYTAGKSFCSIFGHYRYIIPGACTIPIRTFGMDREQKKAETTDVNIYLFYRYLHFFRMLFVLFTLLHLSLKCA